MEAPSGVGMRRVSKADIAVCRNHLIVTGNHMPYGITQCYLPPGSGDISAFTPAKAGTRFSNPGGSTGEIRVDLGGDIPR